MAHRTGSLAQDLQASPPLPDPVPAALQRSAADTRPLAPGCYLIGYSSNVDAMVGYDGTLRVDAATGQLIASGDLYQRDVVVPDAPELPVELAPSPDPAAGIPIFPIGRYRHYLRVTQIMETAAGFSLAFETHRFSATAVTLLDGSSTAWPKESALTALMAPAPAPAGHPSPAYYFTGDVIDEAGTAVGRLSLGLVSPYLRKATIEIDRVPYSELPLDNGAGVTWRTVFDKVGWDITALVSDSGVEEPSGEAWNKAEGHAAMLARRDKSDLDAEWRYHILAVRRIDALLATSDPEAGERGVMYDDSVTDSNNLPREGLIVASHWPIPNKDEWGHVKGMRSGATVTYFRTAVHELGHAMGLDHNVGDNGVMHPTDGIARNSLQTPATPFPNNMQWSYAPDDEHRLRHWPDLIVRPAGSKIFSGKTASISSFKSDQLRLEVAPLSSSVPLGAPVRINLRLVNSSDRKTSGPASLSLMSGHVRGQVIDPSGTVRTFAPLVIDENTDTTQPLEPGGAVEGSLTLCRGRHGALFPAPGAYRIAVESSWTVRGVTFFSVGVTNITVSAAVDPVHADAALKVLATPDTLLMLVFGGDHLKEGIDAIGAALKSDVLRPHFAYVEAKRLGTRFGKRMADLTAAAALIDETTVMSPAEFRKAVQMINGDAKSPGAGAMVKALKARAAQEGVADDIKALVRDLQLDS